MKRRTTILGVCGGNGVILYPFLSPKFKLLGNIEPRGIFYTPQNVQWASNFKDIPMVRGAVDFNETVDVIVGAPDCGHSSILSYSRAKSFKEAKENKSLSLFIESIQQFKPKVFVMENLEALLKNYGEDDLTGAFKGYHLKFINAPVSNFGNSQIHRKRLLIVGSIDKRVLRVFELPELDYEKLKVTGNLTKDLLKTYPIPKLCHVRESNNTLITLYAGKKMKVGDIQKLWLNEFPFHKRLPVEGRNFTSAPGVYRNLEDDYPATARKQNRQFNPWGQMMSPRELARVQGIPDSFNLCFEEVQAQYWINKGRVTVTKCPPYEIGLYIKKKILKCQKKLLLS